MVSSQERIGELEKSLVRGDIAGASKALIEIQDRWNEFDEATQEDLTTLEAVYVTMVQRHAARRAGQGGDVENGGRT